MRPKTRSERLSERLSERRSKRRSSKIESFDYKTLNHLGRSWRHLREPTVYKVAPCEVVHGTMNSSLVCYSGQEFVSQDLTNSEIRAKALVALDDMEERFDTDFPELRPRKFMPGAMGIQVIRLNEPEQEGFKIYYHSSMKEKKEKKKQNMSPPHDSKEVQLEEGFKRLMIDDDDGTLPIHRTKYRCAEPGLFTNSRTEHPESSSGSRVYIINRNGQYLPPCIPADAAEIGCHHIVAKAEAVDIRNGWASSGKGYTLAYHWYHAEQVRLPISCHMTPRKVSGIARRIAIVMAEKRAPSNVTTEPSQMAPAAATQRDWQYIARKLALRISSAFDENVAQKMTNRLAFDDAWYKASEVYDQITPHKALEIAQEVCPEIDSATVSEITALVVEKVHGWAAGHPVERMTVQELREQSTKQEPTESIMNLEAGIKQLQLQGEPSAFPQDLMKELENQLSGI